MPAWQEDILQTMGLTLLQPRFDFPQALASDWRWQQDAQPAIENLQGAATASVTTPVGQSSRSILQELLQSDDERTSFAQTQAAVQLRFRCRVVQFDHLLMLLEQPQLQWQDQNLAMPFFADIYFALYGAQAKTVQSLSFQWPPSKNMPGANDVTYARQALATFLQQTSAGQVHTQVLNWGAFNLLFDKKPEWGSVSTTMGLPMLALPPVNYFWQSPLQKRTLWQWLQQLRTVN